MISTYILISYLCKYIPKYFRRNIFSINRIYYAIYIVVLKEKRALGICGRILCSGFLYKSPRCMLVTITWRRYWISKNKILYHFDVDSLNHGKGNKTDTYSCLYWLHSVLVYNLLKAFYESIHRHPCYRLKRKLYTHEHCRIRLNKF